MLCREWCLLVRPIFSETVQNVLPFGGIFRPELLETPLHVNSKEGVLRFQSFKVLFFLSVEYRQEVLQLWNAEHIPLKHTEIFTSVKEIGTFTVLLINMHLSISASILFHRHTARVERSSG